MPERTCDAVFEGGGIKGLALVGALSVVEEAGYQFHNLAGTSAGAIIAALRAAGYTAADLTPIMRDLDFARFLDGGWRWLPTTSRVLNLALHWGFYKGDVFLHWMEEMLAAKGVHTFADLARPSGSFHRADRYKLQVVASDLTLGRMIVLPQDAHLYNINPDNLSVALAVRMSMSIPYFFRPVSMRRLGAPPCYIVDGGLLSNFPISLFDGPGLDQRPTFGFRLAAGDRPQPVRYPIRGLVSFFAAMFFTAMTASDNRYLDTHDFVRTISIDNKGIPATRFALSTDQKELLYESGREAAATFLEQWDFDEYQRRYRLWAGMKRGTLLRSLARAAAADPPEIAARPQD